MSSPTPCEQASEAALVGLAMNGDQAAFGQLVRARQSWLRHLLRRLVHDPSLADELAQQAFIDAWLAIGTLRSVAAFGGWVRQLAVNRALQHWRRARTERLGAAFLDEPVAVTTDAGAALDLDRALARLGAAERVCLVLAYQEGMSHSAISIATGWPLGTVKSHVLRGAARLRTLLPEYGPARGQEDDP